MHAVHFFCVASTIITAAVHSAKDLTDDAVELGASSELRHMNQVRHGQRFWRKARACPKNMEALCKPLGNYGGGKCLKGMVYGHSCTCAPGFKGAACDFGPYKCGQKVCVPKGLEVHKSLALSAIQLSILAYFSDKAKWEKQCPGISKRMPLQYVSFCRGMSSKCVLKGAFGAAHGSYGQLNGNETMYAVTFRGTVGARDWKTDLTVFQRRFRYRGKNLGIVHKGFLDAFQPHINHMVSAVQKQAHGHTHLLVTGHSLGGAFANLFAAVMKIAMPHLKIQLITFGTPRVGNGRFQKIVEGSMDYIARFVNKRDVVPQNPQHLAAFITPKLSTNMLGESAEAEWGRRRKKSFFSKIGKAVGSVYKGTKKIVKKAVTTAGKAIVKAGKYAAKKIKKAGKAVAKRTRHAMVIVHVGPQITMGCTDSLTTNPVKQHKTSLYESRIRKHFPGKDESLCPK